MMENKHFRPISLEEEVEARVLLQNVRTLLIVNFIFTFIYSVGVLLVVATL